jgi:hypothetical protein
MKFFIIYNKNFKVINVYKIKKNRRIFLLSLNYEIKSFYLKNKNYIFLFFAEVLKKSGLY